MKPIKKILIYLVDDDRTYVSALKYAIGKGKDDVLDIRMFPTGEECVQNLHHDPSIIVLDYNLNTNYPDAMNGAEVLRKIRMRSPHTDVIILSSQEDIDIAMQTLNTGAYDYVVKTNDGFAKIKKAVSRILEEAELLDEVESHADKYKLIGMYAALIGLLILLLGIVL